MSIRTVIEVNHDYLHDLKDHPQLWLDVLQKMFANDWECRHTQLVPGVRKLGERHHSETLKLTIS